MWSISRLVTGTTYLTLKWCIIIFLIEIAINWGREPDSPSRTTTGLQEACGSLTTRPRPLALNSGVCFKEIVNLPIIRGSWNRGRGSSAEDRAEDRVGFEENYYRGFCHALRDSKTEMEKIYEILWTSCICRWFFYIFLRCSYWKWYFYGAVRYFSMEILMLGGHFPRVYPYRDGPSNDPSIQRSFPAVTCHDRSQIYHNTWANL